MDREKEDTLVAAVAQCIERLELLEGKVDVMIAFEECVTWLLCQAICQSMSDPEPHLDAEELFKEITKRTRNILNQKYAAEAIIPADPLAN